MSRLPVYSDAPAGGDRVLLDTLGVIRGLRLSTTINGDWAASWQADLPARLDHRALQPGRVVTVPVSPSQAWQGALAAPQRGTPWRFTALGSAQLLDRWSAIDTTAGANALNLNEVVDEAITRGLAATRPASLPSLPAGTAQSGTLTLAAALGQVTAQLNEWWNISRAGAITAAALPSNTGTVTTGPLPTVTQSAQASTSSGTGLTVTLGAAPATGDVMVACFNISQFSASRDLTLPAGWTLLDSVVNVDNRIVTIYRAAGASEPSSFTFGFTGSAQTHSAVMIVVNGSSGAPSAHTAANTQTTTLTAPNTGDLPLAFFIQNDGTGNGNTTNSVSTAGWATDQNNAPGFHANVGGHGPATTAGVAVAPAVSWGGAVQNPMSAIVILPAPVTVTSPIAYILQAQDTAGGRVIDGFVTDVTCVYLNAANYKITTLQRSNVAARSKYGRSEQFLDLTGQGPISTANAQTAGDNYLAVNAPRLKFAGSFQVVSGQLLNAGGAPVDLATAISGLLTRLLLTDPDTNAGELSIGALQLVIGQTDYDVDPDVLTLTPLDYSPQGLAALVSGGSQSAGGSQASLAYGSMANLPAVVPRGRVITASAASGSGVTAETLIASGTATLSGGQRYEVTGDIGNIWGSATNGQAVLRLRYAAGASVTTAGTQLGVDKRAVGFTTQNITGQGSTAVADLVPASDGQYTVGLFLLQGNTNAALAWTGAELFADSAGV